MAAILSRPQCVKLDGLYVWKLLELFCLFINAFRLRQTADILQKAFWNIFSFKENVGNSIKILL